MFEFLQFSRTKVLLLLHGVEVCLEKTNLGRDQADRCTILLYELLQQFNI